jgi:hypothetical protein
MRPDKFAAQSPGAEEEESLSSMSVVDADVDVDSNSPPHTMM